MDANTKRRGLLYTASLLLLLAWTTVQVLYLRLRIAVPIYRWQRAQRKHKEVRQ